MKRVLTLLLFVYVSFSLTAISPKAGPIRILVVTGGHGYKVEEFNQMLSSLGENITYQVAELPGAFDMFLTENRSKYDVLTFENPNFRRLLKQSIEFVYTAKN